MNICIFGGGPTGLRLTDELSKKGYNIELHDKESKLGGCWKVDWENGYYREHAPRVMSTGYKRTFEILKRFGVKTSNIYGNVLYTSNMFLQFFYRNLSFSDLNSFIYALMFIKEDDKRTLKEWMEDNKISPLGRKCLRKMGLSLATNEREMLAYIFFTTVSSGQGSNLLQSTENDLWILKWEKELSERPNVTIFKDSKLKSLKCKDNKITEAKTNNRTCKADTYICSFPLHPLKDLVKNCSEYIQSNWMEPKEFQKYCIESSYSGLGFQLHFTEDLQSPSTWNIKGFTDWEIEVLSVNSYSKEPTKNSHIKEVWSCVIVDTNSYSNYLKKKVNQIDDINIVLNESIRQLSIAFGKSLMPFNVTVSKGIFYDYEKKFWEMEHSAYNPFRKGPLPTKGKIDNLYSVGPHNLFELTVLEGAFKSADKFIEEFAN